MGTAWDSAFQYGPTKDHGTDKNMMVAFAASAGGTPSGNGKHPGMGIDWS